MIPIYSDTTSGTYNEIVNISLSIDEANENLYGIVYSIHPNIFTFSQNNPTTVPIFNDCTCTYSVFLKSNPNKTIQSFNSININITKELLSDSIFNTNYITDDTSDIDKILIDYSLYNNDAIIYLATNSFYDYDKQFSTICDSTTFNENDFNPNNNITFNYNKNCKYVNQLENNLNYITENNYITYLKNSSNNAYTNPIFYKSKVNSNTVLTPTIFSTNSALHYYSYAKKFYITTEQPTYEQNHQLKIQITDDYNNSIIHSINLDTTAYTITCDDGVFNYLYYNKIYLNLLTNATVKTQIYNPQLMSNSAIYIHGSQSPYEMTPPKPIIDSTISDNKITIQISALATRFYYKLHIDTTNFDTTTDLQYIEINRSLSDFTNFNDIQYKTITIDCTSNINSIEGYCYIGLMSKQESTLFVTCNIYSILTNNVIDYNDLDGILYQTHDHKDFLYTYLLLYLGASNLTKQIVSTNNTPTLPIINTIFDDYNNILEINTSDIEITDVKYYNNLTYSIDNNHIQKLYNILSSIDKNLFNIFDRNILFKNGTFITLSEFTDIFYNTNLIVDGTNYLITFNDIYLYTNLNYNFCAPIQIHEFSLLAYQPQNLQSECRLYKNLFEDYNIYKNKINIDFKMYLYSKQNGNEYMIDVDELSDSTNIKSYFTLSNVTLSEYLSGHFNKILVFDNTSNFNNLQSVSFYDITTIGTNLINIISLTITNELPTIDINFNDPQLPFDNTSKYFLDILKIIFVPYITISGGNIENGTVIDDVTNYNIDYIINNIEFYEDDTTMINCDITNIDTNYLNIQLIKNTDNKYTNFIFKNLINVQKFNIINNKITTELNKTNLLFNNIYTKTINTALKEKLNPITFNINSPITYNINGTGSYHFISQFNTTNEYYDSTTNILSIKASNIAPIYSSSTNGSFPKSYTGNIYTPSKYNNELCTYTNYSTIQKYQLNTNVPIFPIILAVKVGYSTRYERNIYTLYMRFLDSGTFLDSTQSGYISHIQSTVPIADQYKFELNYELPSYQYLCNKFILYYYYVTSPTGYYRTSYEYYTQTGPHITYKTQLLASSGYPLRLYCCNSYGTTILYRYITLDEYPNSYMDNTN